MGINHKVEDGASKEAKQGSATVFPGKKGLVKKMMLDQVVQCLHRCSDEPKPSMQGSNDGSVSTGPPPKGK
ncbi:hypothetical protein V6N13_047907 [Hibiscus sabdariffa]|uniref:Uncharacterized protein n=1 Tax=Hibiscus sabdariffa TaxID=183260 RepID=A0ABR2F5K8_9ROSI